MSLVIIKYVGRLDAVEVEHPVGATITVKHGETIGLPARLAGRPPSDDDPGAGFLAQSDNWQNATTKTRGE